MKTIFAMSPKQFNPLQLFVVLLLPLFIMGNPTIKGKHKLEKTISKSYSVNPNALLKITNSYGDIDITTWSENTIKIDVTITANGYNKQHVIDKLNSININFKHNASLVSAETEIGKSKSNSWFNWGFKNDVNYKITYTVKLPITNNIDLANDYGAINLDTLEGSANINCDYGSITIKELMNANNTLTFDYSKGFFNYINNATIRADYSDFEINKVRDLQLISDYGKSEITTAENIIYNCDYGSLTIDKSNSVSGKSDFLTLRLGSLFKTLNVEADYGSLKLDNLKASASEVKITSDYMKISIGYDTDIAFNFSIDLSFTDLHHDNTLEFNKKHSDITDKYYSGYYNTENSDTQIVIKSDYGSVSLYKN